MPKPRPKPTDLPDLTNAPTPHVPTSDLTEDDWHDLLTEAAYRRNEHKRCGTKQNCYRERAALVDFLLDEWLRTHATHESL